MELATTQEPQKIKFFYGKAQGCRSIFADGVIGGFSPKQVLRMGFFAERAALPISSTHQDQQNPGSEGGMRLAEVSRESDPRGAYEREIQVEVVLNLDTAIAMHDWLSTHLRKLMKNENDISNITELPTESAP